MTVNRILNEKGAVVETAGRDARLREIASTLADRKIGAIVIMDKGEIAGILSERDIVRAVAHDGIVALERPARDYMTRKVVTCGQHETINDVMQKMTAGRFRHLPVVENGKLVGIVSIGDVVKRRIAEVEQEAREMRDYIAHA
jgi:CBS domain-containing protein